MILAPIYVSSNHEQKCLSWVLFLLKGNIYILEQNIFKKGVLEKHLLF